MSSPARLDGVTAVVVTYNPDIARLKALCEATRPQVGHIVLVDNGSRPCAACARVGCGALGMQGIPRV